MKELYIRFLIWLGAAPPEGYEYHIPSDEVENSSFRIFANFGFSFIRLLIPFDNFVIHTNLTPKATQQKLLGAFKPVKIFRPTLPNHKQNQFNVIGNIKFDSNKFNIGIIFYRNAFPYQIHSFPSRIQGEIHRNPKGTTVEIRMRLDNFVIIVWVISYGIWAWIILTGIIVVLQNGWPPSDLSISLLFLGATFGGIMWLLSMVVFRRGVVAAKSFLRKLFV